MGATSLPPDAILRIDAQLLSLLNDLAAAAPTTEPIAPGVVWRSAGVLTFSVGIAPVITDQPDNLTVNPGDEASFAIVATNAESYQWRRDSVAIVGATGTTYAFTTSESNNGDLIDCVVTGPGGTATSNAATLTVVVPQEYLHILVIGQSNAVGGAGAVLSTSSPVYTPVPLMFNAGPRPGGTGLTSLVPLVESTSETVCSGFATRMNSLQPSKQFIFSIAALSGNAYANLKKGSVTYSDSIAQITAAKSLAEGAGGVYKVAAILCLHGEQDELLGNTAYASNLLEWQSDYESDILPITGQGGTIPLFACQQVGASAAGPSSAGAAGTAIQLYNAWKAQPTKVVLIGSRYLYGCQQGSPSNLHIGPWAQRWHGQFYANAVNAIAIESTSWKPLTPIPTEVVRIGSTITARFNVQHPPIQIKFDWVGRILGNCGFTFFDDSGTPPTVTSVSVASSDTLTLTLSGTPSGTAGSMLLRYGYGTSTAGPMAYGTRGNICDSNAAVSSIDGLPLRNWLNIFSEAVT